LDSKKTLSESKDKMEYTNDLNSLNDFANVISYPSESHYQLLLSSLTTLNKERPSFSSELSIFRQYVDDVSGSDLEELYAKTFEIQGVCCMDLGYVLFGEEYKRGAFLVNVTKMLDEFEVDPGSELADHLPNVLVLLTKMPDSDERRDFIEKIVIPSLEKMLERFPQKEGATNIYRYPLEMIKKYLEEVIAKEHLQ
jgi:nitrate reductase assembly molybdenum cofactor insertion protein NarJ